ncbi:MAG: transcription-repair coupling factor [Candidatus Aminicenantes bacterium]|nr:MAG: transcription-repair coupling factor [Candidatus Aminicenantes bacterium]
MSIDFLRETEEFKKLLESIKSGQRSIRITGVTEPAKPYFLSTLAQETKKRVVFIQSSSSSLSRIEEQCGFYLSQYSSDISPRPLPALSENPYQEIFPSLDSVSSRMRFFYELLHGSPALVVTNLFGLLKPFPNRQNIKHFFLGLEKGEAAGRDRVLRILSEYGYSREDLINSHGEYAWRGGIVDVFSPWQPFPFRIEFSGDEIVSLREFEPSSQRSTKKIDRILLPSLREFPGSPQFLQEWEELAKQRDGSRLLLDIKEKTEQLEKGDFFPSFVYLSLLHKDHYVPFTDHFEDSLFVIDGVEGVDKEWEETLKDIGEQYRELEKNRKLCLSPEEIYPPHLWEKLRSEAIYFQELDSSGAKKTLAFPFQSVPRFQNKIPFFLQYLRRLQDERERCFIYFSSQGVRQKLASLLSQHQILHVESSNPFTFPKDGSIVLLVGPLNHGFSYSKEKMTLFSERDIFTEEKVVVSRPRVKPFISHFQDLGAGDHVVHTDYGIGIFKGLVRMKVDKMNREFIELVYKDDDKLFVPVEDLNLVQKYSKMGTVSPILNKLGSLSWERTKARTKRVIEKMAKELLQLYAQRKAIKGFSFSPEGSWQSEFERIFEYEETQDQLLAIKEIMRDMGSESPMDRLLCGDVGYGKTEVAMRAAFKAVMDGKQVAVLCPTTVLASQHLKTLRNRMVLFPIRVEGLTRLQTKGKQKRTVEDLKKGLVDIIIGTHRLLSKDVQFNDLGLLIIDEEQRFGVNHKEKIKKMKANIDVLTLTATPIPRTLNLSLTGLRDISLIETPPKDRLAIHTVVTPFNTKLIASAIKMELARGGQVYYIHNKIKDIEDVSRLVEKLVPQAKVTVIHGQMPGLTLEKRMIDFITQKSNVLVSTTIIENGIDIPLVNTLIVDRADAFGLAQLYQLRGRVGRSSRQAVSYFMVPPFAELNPLAKQRLKALREFSELGSGFRLAAKDLEIRGAGNFLGFEQHGYMEAVGFDYYMHLLEQTIKKLKGDASEEVKSEINLKVDIQIPEDYLPQINLRLNLYKRVSSIESLDEIDNIKNEIEDRFGPLPSSVRNLLCYGVIKHFAQKIKIHAIDRVGRKLIFKFFPEPSANLSRMTSLIEEYSGSISPQGVMGLPIRAEDDSEILDETISVLKELSVL